MPDRHTCDICGARIEPHAHYIVRIDVFADPSVPPISTDDLDEIDAEKTISQLLEEMKNMSADELQDQVHRRFEYRICRSCQAKFLSNPLGQPRQRKIGEN
jgi:ribosomal protein L40E